LPIFFSTAAFDPSENRHSWLARGEKLNPALREDEPPAFHPTLLGPQEVDLPENSLCQPDGTRAKLNHGARPPGFR
jgi:hypothetical protein